MTIHTGDCVTVMRTMPADSVDAVVTDPPYGLEFMGKEWDAFRLDDPGTARHRGVRASGKGITKVNSDEPRPADNPWQKEASGYRGGDRPMTNRCVGCGKRDQFRNPHSCPEGTPWKSELIDPYAAPPTSLAFQNWCRTWALEALRVTKPGGYLLAFGGTRTHHRLVCGLEDAGWIIRDELTWVYASGFPKGKANLKPAHEPIVLARKPGPLRPLGIDAARIPGADPLVRPAISRDDNEVYGKGLGNGTQDEPAGRWPSNLLLSDPALFDEPNPEVVGSGATVHVNPPGQLSRRESSGYGGGWGDRQPFGYDTDGGYSRFFLVPKSSRADREPVVRGTSVDYDHSGPRGHVLNGDGTPRPPAEPRENGHPTVKPVDLMRHLIRLVTPSGGTVLDPFLGSGSTLIAAELEGFPWIGIEQDASYVAIAEARLNGTQRGMGLDVSAPTRKRTESTGQATGYDWGESQADAVVPYSGKKLRSGVHYGDGLRRPEQVPKPVADSAPMWSIEEPA